MPDSSTAAPPLRFCVIGAGSRGNAYARAVTAATTATIHAVAETHDYKRQEFGRNYIWGATGTASDGQSFADWRAWLQWETDRRARIQNQPPDHHQQQDSPPGVDGVFICTLDETHVEILHAIAPLNLHILCEKPLTLSLADCLSVYEALGAQSVHDEDDTSSTTNTHTTPINTSTSTPKKIFSIGHVLRYSPHNILLRNLLLVEKAIGQTVSLEHCEPVGWWHFSHSYVRGNWRRETPAGDGSLLTKSCHDVDFIMWLLSSPAPTPTTPSGTGEEASTRKLSRRIHHPRTISSTGRLTQFRRSRKPAAAGPATNCVACPAERSCNYSAVRIYRDMHTAKGEYRWPVKIVCPEIEDVVRSVPATAGEGAREQAASEYLMGKLEEDYTGEMPDKEVAARPWFGRCVYESDNDVCDDQVVTITWDDERAQDDVQGQQEEELRTAKTAVFHMIAPTEKQCERRGRVYGTEGELSYDSRTITIYSFATRTSRVIEVPRQPPEEERSHGGGDYGLVRSFVRAVDAVESGRMGVEEAQRGFVGCTLEEAVRSHAVVFAAEEARREEKVVHWGEWWEKAKASVSSLSSR